MKRWSHIGRSFDILVPPGVISFSHLWNIPRISSLGTHWFMGIGTGVIIMINNDSDDDYYDDENNHDEANDDGIIFQGFEEPPSLQTSSG